MLTVEDIESKSYRVVEILLLLPTALYGLAGVGILLLGVMTATGLNESASAGRAALTGVASSFSIAYIGLLVVGVVSWLLTPIVLYLDTKKVSEAEVEWDPNPLLWAVGGFFLGYLMKMHHLYYRHQHIVDWEGRNWWWAFVAVGTVGPSLCFGAAFVLSGTVSFGVVTTLVGLGVLLAVPFPLAIYRDATFVRLNSPAWQPNPGNYIGASLFLLFFAPISYPLTGGYYLLRRQRALGSG